MFMHMKGVKVKVSVHNNNIEKAIRVLKRKLQTEGVFKEMRQREFYEQPSTKRRREKNEAVRRSQRDARKSQERDRTGL